MLLGGVFLNEENSGCKKSTIFPTVIGRIGCGLVGCVE
jgi:hypothetical protein